MEQRGRYLRVVLFFVQRPSTKHSTSRVLLPKRLGFEMSHMLPIYSLVEKILELTFVVATAGPVLGREGEGKEGKEKGGEGTGGYGREGRV